MKRLSLLLAVLLLVVTVPVAATTTPGDSTYKRILLWQTEFGQNVRDTVHNYVGDWPMEASAALYDSFLSLFNGATDKNGVTYSSSLPITDSEGWVWYPWSKDKFTPSSSSTTSSEVRTVTSSDTLYSYHGQRSAASGQLIQFSESCSNLPSAAGTYWLYIDSASSGVGGDRVFVMHGDVNASGAYGPIKQGLQFQVANRSGWYITCQWSLKSNAESPAWSNMWFTASAYIVKIAGPDMAASGGFTGFGGGQTRGAGSGRKFDLISASKVSAGTGISRADVLEQCAIFDEGTKTVNIPQDDGTTVTKTAESWVYDYPTRTYTITTPTKETVKVVYAEDKVSVIDSSNTPKEYYYAEPEPLPTTTPSETTTSPGGGTTTAPDDSGGGGGIFGIFGWLKDLVNGIFGGIGDLFSTITAAFNSIASFGTGFANLIAHYFSYIPSEIAALIVLSFSALVLMRIFGR